LVEKLSGLKQQADLIQ